RTSAGMGRYRFEYLGDDSPLLSRVCFGPSLGRTRLFRAADVSQLSYVAQLTLDEGPATHVLGLLLQPDQLARRAVLVQHVQHGVFRKRIELLDADQRRVVGIGAAFVGFDLGP